MKFMLILLVTSSILASDLHPDDPLLATSKPRVSTDMSTIALAKSEYSEQAGTSSQANKSNIVWQQASPRQYSKEVLILHVSNKGEALVGEIKRKPLGYTRLILGNTIGDKLEIEPAELRCSNAILKFLGNGLFRSCFLNHHPFLDAKLSPDSKYLLHRGTCNFPCGKIYQRFVVKRLSDKADTSFFLGLSHINEILITKSYLIFPGAMAGTNKKCVLCRKHLSLLFPNQINSYAGHNIPGLESCIVRDDSSNHVHISKCFMNEKEDKLLLTSENAIYLLRVNNTPFAVNTINSHKLTSIIDHAVCKNDQLLCITKDKKVWHWDYETAGSQPNHILTLNASLEEKDIKSIETDAQAKVLFILPQSSNKIYSHNLEKQSNDVIEFPWEVDNLAISPDGKNLLAVSKNGQLEHKKY